MLSRYKKKGGFLQILTLIESSGKAKQEHLLGLISQESPLWESTIRKYILSYSRVFNWPQDEQYNALSRVLPITLATSMYGMTPEEIDQKLSSFPPIQKRKFENMIGELKATPAEVMTCQMKLVSEIRSLIGQGYIKLEKVDPELVLPENIDEQLSHEKASPFSQKPQEQKTLKPQPAQSSVHGNGVPVAGQTSNISEFHEAQISTLNKKLLELQSENTQLKERIEFLNDKLAQIRKIA